MTFNEAVILGQDRPESTADLGISSSYGAPAAAFEEAFERGCNYFVMGSFMKGRSKEMIKAIQNITKKGKRDKLVVCLMEYTHSYMLGKRTFLQGIEQAGSGVCGCPDAGLLSQQTPGTGDGPGTGPEREGGGTGTWHYRDTTGSCFPNCWKVPSIFSRCGTMRQTAGLKQDVFPHLGGENRPGMISFTATRWGQLLKESKMPAGEKPLTASGVLSFCVKQSGRGYMHDRGPQPEMMRENLVTLDSGPLT